MPHVGILKWPYPSYHHNFELRKRKPSATWSWMMLPVVLAVRGLMWSVILGDILSLARLLWNKNLLKHLSIQCYLLGSLYNGSEKKEIIWYIQSFWISKPNHSLWEASRVPVSLQLCASGLCASGDCAPVPASCSQLYHTWQKTSFLDNSQRSVQDQIYVFLSFFYRCIFLSVFKYSGLHFPPSTPPTPAIHTTHPRSYPGIKYILNSNLISIILVLGVRSTVFASQVYF